MQTIKITISVLQPSHIVVKESKPGEKDIIDNLTQLLRIIQPKEALQQ
ncbi:MAG: hypothetical protein KH020_10920 [Clostridiales bacterium]|nr:hypothetical protein [Clostridiales bacterium]